jgi:hypothetical protein
MPSQLGVCTGPPQYTSILQVPLALAYLLFPDRQHCPIGSIPYRGPLRARHHGCAVRTAATQKTCRGEPPRSRAARRHTAAPRLKAAVPRTVNQASL